MKCLSDRIGLRVCGWEGDLYIDALPEISFKDATKITDEIAKASDFLKQLIEDASDEVANDIASGNDLFQFNAVLAHQTIHKFNEDDTGSVSGTITIENIHCDEYAAIRVDFIRVKPTTVVTNGLIEITHECGVDQFPYEADCLEKIEVNKVYDGEISISHTATGTFEMTTGYSCSCSSYQSCSTCTGTCARVVADATTGMQVKIACICDKEKFVCRYAPELTKATQLKSAIYYFRSILSTTRLHPLITWHEEKAKADLERFEALYKEEKIRALDNIKAALLRENSACIDCVGLSYVLSEP